MNKKKAASLQQVWDNTPVMSQQKHLEEIWHMLLQRRVSRLTTNLKFSSQNVSDCKAMEIVMYIFW